MRHSVHFPLWCSIIRPELLLLLIVHPRHTIKPAGFSVRCVALLTDFKEFPANLIAANNFLPFLCYVWSTIPHRRKWGYIWLYILGLRFLYKGLNAEDPVPKEEIMKKLQQINTKWKPELAHVWHGNAAKSERSVISIWRIPRWDQDMTTNCLVCTLFSLENKCKSVCKYIYLDQIHFWNNQQTV